jgi:hypoxanthine phosphoribosyltransferase
MKYYHSWEELNSNVATICQQMAVDDYKPDVIVGPGRGGYIMGVMLSHYFGVPFEGFNLALRDHVIADFPALTHILSKYKFKNILICDDLNDSGETLNMIDNVVTENSLTIAPKYCTIYDKLSSNFGKKVDYTAKEVGYDTDKDWIVFPYEEWWK